jgi:hypothetical protein
MRGFDSRRSLVRSPDATRTVSKNVGKGAGTVLVRVAAVNETKGNAQFSQAERGRQDRCRRFSLPERRKHVNARPVILLEPVFHFLDAFIRDYGLYIYMVTRSFLPRLTHYLHRSVAFVVRKSV